MKLAVVYHMTDLPGWCDIAHEQFTKIKKSSLLQSAEIYVNLQGHLDVFRDFQKIWQHEDRIQWLYAPSCVQDYEFPTWALIKNMADQASEDLFILYLHQKGVSHIGKQSQISTMHWRHYLDYFNVECWQQCVNKLDQGCDVVGTEWVSFPRLHFSGSTQWMCSRYLKTLPALQLPSNVGFRPQLGLSNDYRFESELYTGLNNPQVHNFHNSHTDMYQIAYLPHNYR
jgi:hypothetical protein